MCIIEKTPNVFTKQSQKVIGNANKKMRKVENSYLLPFLCLPLKYEANTAACSQVTMRKTMVTYSAALRLDSQLWKAREKLLTNYMNGMLVYVVTQVYGYSKKIGAIPDV